MVGDAQEQQPQKTTHGLQKFLLLLSFLLTYFIYLSWQYDLATGGIVSALTWSFFVLCTPIADAGFLLDFPVRLITGMRMALTELIVWTLAISINAVTLTFSPASYDTTALTQLFRHILITPWPYWSIIALCALGTFLSIEMGDEVFDKVTDKKDEKQAKTFKKKLIAMLVLMGVIVLIYYDLLKTLGVSVPQG